MSGEDAPEGLRLTRDGALAVVTFDRPPTRNALTLGDLQDLSAALDDLAADPGVRALALTGAGDRVFSAGVDLSDVSDDVSVWEDNPLTAAADKLMRFPRPTIARINGAVVGGAAELTIACDFRIGAANASVMVPAIRLGVHYDPKGLERAARILGLSAARRIYLSGEKLTAEALVRLGFLDGLEDDLDAGLADLAGRLTGGAPLAVDGIKQTLTEIAYGALDEAAAAARVQAAWASEDVKEGVAAMRERRAPDFKGR